MKTTNFIVALALATFVFTSCEQTEVEMLTADQLKSVTIDNFVAPHVFTTTVDDLTQAEIDGLQQMREEEKMARDIYTYFYENYGVLVFDRIANSEGQHSSAVLSLIQYFGLTDPALAEVGVFTNPDIQALYDQLTAAGSTIELALSTGAYIEEYDIADLQKLIAATTNADIKLVYSNLERGSENHLRAFTSNLKAFGSTYTPQILDSADYTKILAASNGNGIKGSKGNNGKKGNGSNGKGTGNVIDANGDGLCDTTGLPVGQNSGVSNQGNSNGNKGNKGKGRK